MAAAAQRLKILQDLPLLEQTEEATRLQYRFMNPGTNLPLTEYTYAEDAPTPDIVP